MRHEVHVHADIPILEGVSRRQIEQAFAPWLEYLDADGLADVKSLEPDEPGLKFDEKELILYVCWTGEIGRSFHPALEQALENIGPYCYEAVEVDLNIYLENGDQMAPVLQAFSSDKRGGQVQAEVNKVEFTSATEADVTYTLTLKGATVMPDAKGTAVEQDDVWKVSVKTLCGLVGLSGNASPLPGC